MMVHTCRQLLHILPSGKPDQLCYAVIRPRTIQQMKAKKYSNSFSMFEQKGTFWLAKENAISSHVVEELRQSVLSDESNLKYDVHREGATFVPVKAVVSMLKGNCDVSIEVIFESENSAGTDITKKIKRSWSTEIYPIQK
eukprot:14625941-Ditylum_brightwellii.AAC.1